MTDLAEEVRKASHFKAAPDELRFLSAMNEKHICDRCGKCCENTVGITGKELILIAEHFGVSVRECRITYIEKRCDGWLLLRKKDGKCPFLKTEEGGTRCSIYAVRPTTCRNFPWLSPVTIMSTKLPKVGISNDLCPNMVKSFMKAQQDVKDAQGVK